MTEKRFTYEQESLTKVNVFDSDGEFVCCTLSVWADQLVDKLNALHEENIQLKERNEFLKKQLDRVCIDNETMGDKLKKIGRIL